MDEAHTLDIEVGRALLNAAQDVGSRASFLLVLAGTPNLEGRFNAMGVSFWNRAEQIRVSRLSEEATAAALRTPFEREGLTVARDSLAAIVRESQRYPYFVQLLGQAVWAGVDAPGVGSRVTAEVVDAARLDFDRTKRRFYRQRLDELKKRRLLGVGRGVAEAFRESRVVADSRLEAAVIESLDDTRPEAADEATGTLRDLGYIWRADERPEWEPGIPSLLDYVRRYAPAP